MDLQLKDKAALVTGASMGIGHAIARGLASEGVRVCVVARRRNLLDELSARIVKDKHPRPEIVVAYAPRPSLTSSSPSTCQLGLPVLGSNWVIVAVHFAICAARSASGISSSLR